MFNGVEYVREVCNARRIPITQLEKDCGFSNGYLNPKKLQKIPYERAKKIAAYLGLSLDYILNGPEVKEMPTPGGERTVEDEDIKFALFGGGEITDEMYEEVKRFAQFIKEREHGKQ